MRINLNAGWAWDRLADHSLRDIRGGHRLAHTRLRVDADSGGVRPSRRFRQAAGAIHTDFERGFIRAETIAFGDYVAGGGEAGAREAGKLRLEGKEYEVADGDVMHFRFAT